MIGFYNTVDSAALFQFAPRRVRDPHDGDVRRTAGGYVATGPWAGG